MTTPTAPAPGAIRLPNNKFLTTIIECLDGYTDALDDAQAIDDYLRSLTPIPPVPAGVALGPIDEWQLAEDGRDAAVEKLERHRNRALVRRRGAIAVSASVLRGAVDDVLQQLHLRLVEVLLKAGPDAEVLIDAGVDSAGAAIERDRVAEWQRLNQEAWPDYRLLRDSQEAVVLQIAPQRIWMSAKPSLDGEPPAKRGQKLVWTAAESAVLDDIAFTVDRMVRLRRDWSRAEDPKLRIRLSAEIRLLETSKARLLTQVTRDLPAPESMRTIRARRAVNARWKRDGGGDAAS